MNRRALLVAGLLASTSPVAARAASRIAVIYVGGEDCEPCVAWKKRSRASWVGSPEYARVTFVEIEAPRLREVYQERYWPGDLGPVLGQLPRKSGTPRFLIVKDGRVVSNEFGGSKWANTMADLKQLVG